MNPYGEASLPHLSFTVLSTLNTVPVFSLGEDNEKLRETVSRQKN